MNLGDRWGAETSPDGFDLYVQSSEEIAPGIVDVARSIQTVGESLIDAISRARLQVAMTDYQTEMLRLNLENARTGRPPVSVAQYSGTGGTSIDTKTVMIALLGLGALVLARG